MSDKEPKVDEALAIAHGLKPEEYQRFVALIGRTPSYTELGIVSAMWNEHCSYKSSRLHLRKLPTKAPWVIQGPGENAGVIDIGDGDAVIFKMESHNHPSFIEPYQGAATGVGGILRDVFTMGARPVASLDFLRFGAPDHPKTRHLVAGVVAGIGGYGNSFGVPTVGGSVGFHKRYDGNILVNAMAVGVARADAIFYAKATGVGNPIVYLGSKTGRDGIHGASMASASFEADAEAKRPTVQVGDPFAEKLLLEACLELMASGAVVAIQDMGAAGLTSSAVEMGAKGDLGVELDLDLLPCREDGMTAYEMMLSESQERMLMVLKPEKEPEAEAIFRKWGLDFAVIGKTTDSKRFVVKHGGVVKADLPIRELEPPFAEDRLGLGLLLGLEHHQHALLALREHHLVGAHAGLPARHLVEIERNAEIALGAHLDRRAGQAGGAHVLDSDDAALGHDFEAGFEQKLLRERVADLHGRTLLLGVGAKLGRGHGGAVNAVAPGF